MKDLDYIDKLLRLIEKEEIPAPGPIEQRWTARSKSPMSPASSSEDDVFSWVINLSCPIVFFSVCLICAAIATCNRLPKSSFATHTNLFVLISLLIIWLKKVIFW